jgi:hypothetical protein
MAMRPCICNIHVLTPGIIKADAGYPRLASLEINLLIGQELQAHPQQSQRAFWEERTEEIAAGNRKLFRGYNWYSNDRKLLRCEVLVDHVTQDMGDQDVHFLNARRIG